MNKQQLAAKIWASANQMRSKIDANEYKDYILGFIFYKFLSDQQVAYLKAQGWPDAELAKLTEDDTEMLTDCQHNLGYFIAYKHLFSTWLSKGKDFDVSDVTDALSAFNRLIDVRHRKLFSRIFDTLDTGLSKLGDSSGGRTKAISGLLHLIKDIPMDGKQDYDVLGFVYEFLISNFAANAGKKAGEFYTPHEVSLLMSEIVANHLKGQERIEIYDPTSGSGSLLINIGRCAGRSIGSDNIKYYAQEWKENTYNLTRMNLVMRGIKPDNIVTRNGDTLADDWPYFDDDHEYTPLFVDAVVSNPPYSQHWDSANMEHDPRFEDYGLAPTSKADYAFLLHDLYHLRPHGIMTIVLPHGVLFRGDASKDDGEGKIRKNLIERDKIDAIIGLPPNIFFGTGIPTIIMVLRKERANTDVLIIDASKGFAKVGKNNVLRASDIKRIADTVAGRLTIEKYSRVVSKEEIRRNAYNLNIPRYVDASDSAETWDLYATMFGGIPNAELDRLRDTWSAFPRLRESLFTSNGTPYVSLAVTDVKDAILQHPDVQSFMQAYQTAFADFEPWLAHELLDDMTALKLPQEEARISDAIFARIARVALIDPYQAYQLLDDAWQIISIDMEIVQTEGFPAVKQVDPNMVIKKREDQEEEIQVGWVGHVIPFALVQATFLRDEANAVTAKEQRLTEIAAEYEELLDSLTEEDKEGDFLNEDSTAFVNAGLRQKLDEIYADVETAELTGLRGYLALLDSKATKGDKLQYVAAHTEVDWSAVEGNATCAKGKVLARVKALQGSYAFPEDSLEAKLLRVEALQEEEKDVRREVRELANALHLHTKQAIEALTDEQAVQFLRMKWIRPLCAALQGLPMQLVSALVKTVQSLAEKYDTTLVELERQLTDEERALTAMLDQLTGSDYDRKALAELKALLAGE